MVPFAGFLLPVQYGTGVIAEHMAVRTACGLFDVSHMGEILCEGEAALDNLNHLLTNDFTSMVDGQARYSPMCNEEGGVVDDLIVYKIRAVSYTHLGNDLKIAALRETAERAGRQKTGDRIQLFLPPTAFFRSRECKLIRAAFVFKEAEAEAGVGLKRRKLREPGGVEGVEDLKTVVP